jgi:glycosyltransferase involved in cell wall biosynthesis
VFATFQNISKRYPPPFSWFERYALRRANGIIAFGDTVAETLAGRVGVPAHTAVIPPGVDTTLFAPRLQWREEIRRTLGWGDDVLVVGFAGRFVAEKGLDVLTAALDRIEVPWRAIFVGGGPLEPDLRRWAARYPGRVAIRSDVAHHDVPRWLNAMDVLAAPSRTTAGWREQFGRMLIEGFACGVPVVASDSGEIPRVVGDAGVIVPEGDVEAWRDALGRLLTDGPARSALSVAGRQRVLARYDWRVVAAAHASFFDTVIAGCRPAAGRAA